VRVDGFNATPNPEAPLLNPYSCLLCRKKKRKCNRTSPCLNCRNVGAECVFTPRRPSTRQKTSVGAMQRLRNLEDLIGRLRSELESKSSQPPTGDDEIAEGLAQEDTTQSTRVNPINSSGASVDDESELEVELGRLAIGDGRSRYVASGFWTTLSEEVCQVYARVLLELILT